MKLWAFVGILLCSIPILLVSQDMSSMLQSVDTPTRDFAFATFKGTKILNSQSIEGVSAGVLQVMFQHRFGSLEQGFYDFFGLDAAGIRFGFDYGIHKLLTVGVGRSGGGREPFGQKAYDAYAKLKVLRQSTGAVWVPVSVSLLATSAIRSANTNDVTLDRFAYRMHYTIQCIIARKFNAWFSAQLMPTLVHRNLTFTPEDKNTLYALGTALRCKLTKRFGLVGEYLYVFPNQISSLFTPNMVALGLEIETGGHVYHVLFTNASGMVEHQYIGYNSFDITKGSQSIRFGFNLSRVFTLVKIKD